MSKEHDDVLRRWIKAGPPEETPLHENLLMWGVWVSGIGDDEYHPPEAVFRSKEKAEAFAELFDVREWDVWPCVVSVQNRDNFEVPKP
jgi:hypothetical protein